ncbi:stability/partitioning determinant [Erwinia sp. OLTSP20]|uniref:stability/partitioning determinant n=1 Tax=unclassified Erwinia TaxID=2622719 RepID=UPI000C196FDC|nr:MULTISPECIES: stability/partitioning determinant [unclassified Erwinia]PIJ52130.1 stability/partitioning determinant [Erwinia sp. OAMSP11]PIJ73150.1 stability/partitioning determinant [Erwinia sp. OLSSP12]PIJ84659.1 stability/partitioning determinant [Erwinia sp. OLCASP19]PIJ87306.1 stability/partitioning determinant [Erwinia sp. OLMTSP26]PIJ87539.1 stability/partitioning determinant [Erwinia sp. OLMDSP33]
MSRVDPLDSLKNFEPKVATEQKPKQSNAEIEELANKHGFVGRVSTVPTPPADRSKRRFKTGRNVQINIKGEQDTKDELYRVADMIDEPLGETLKRALAALRRELGNGQGTK